MSALKTMISNCNWPNHLLDIDQKGFTILPNILNKEEAQKIISQYDHEENFRKTINMQTFGFGKGQYKYYQYPLPPLIQSLRVLLYKNLNFLANQWMSKLNINVRYSDSYNDLIQVCNEYGQSSPTPLLLKYGKGDFNRLHQDLYGKIYFPFQAVVMLSESGDDYYGGEFVLQEQRPRMQSKPIVLQPWLGDIVILTTNFRPVPGKRSYYKAKMRHGVSEVLGGQRYTLGLIFHDAA